MKQTKIIILIFLIVCLNKVAFCQPTQNCICESYYEKILDYSHKSFQILACGTKSDSDSLIYELTVFNCVKKSFLFDNRYDEIFPHKIEKTENGFIITRYHFAPVGEDWKQTLFPFSETEYSFDANKDFRTTEKTIFNYPELTTNQIIEIKELCDRLVALKNGQKMHYPFDYETIYILFVGAYKDVYIARQLFLDLKIFFEFDGAAAETLREIAIERLIGK